MLMKTGILYFTTCFHGFGILRHVDPFVRMLHIYLKHIVVTCTVRAPFWYVSTKTAMNLKVAYNNSLCRLLGLPSHNSVSSMFVNLNIPSFGELLRKYVYNFRNRLETSDNVIIRGIYLSHITFQSGIWDWWRDILSP